MRPNIVLIVTDLQLLLYNKTPLYVCLLCTSQFSVSHKFSGFMSLSAISLVLVSRLGYTETDMCKCVMMTIVFVDLWKVAEHMINYVIKYYSLVECRFV